jgi:hypothetical protein
MNKLVKQSNLEVALAEEVAGLGGGSFGALLKFDANTKKFSIIGGENVEIGREYIAHADQYARGWVKFVDKRPTEVRVLKVTEGRPPKRAELDEPELADGEDDPWCFQRYLLLEDTKTGELVTFVSKSIGAKIALANLLNTFAVGMHRGLPIVKLAIGTFNTKDYGRRARPDFKITGWTGRNVAAVPLIEAEGPPDHDPADPGYDPGALSREIDDEIPF